MMDVLVASTDGTTTSTINAAVSGAWPSVDSTGNDEEGRVLA